jgi:sugar phosphate isomerase/epimerase
MNRREMLSTVAGFAAMNSFAATTQKRAGMGIVTYALGIRRRAQRQNGGTSDLHDPVSFLEFCHRLGAGGVQVPIGVRDAAYTNTLRRTADEYAMFIEGIAGLPNDKAGVEQFEAEVETAKRAGAKVLRVVIIPGRRYERFKTMEEFRAFAARGLRSLELAEPVAARHRIRLAVENHKDQRIAERLALLKKLDSEYVGMCVDMGNSFALLEDPIEVVEAFGPWAFTVHIKDQAVKEYEEGFLFADMALGEGFLDLPKMVGIVRAAHPEARFSLETITRDPLQVPCLTESYWATFADVPGSDLARTLRTVRAHEHSGPLPQISGLPLEEQVKREEQNVRRSLAYARESLGM